jgi:predicted glycoside hydrolase/deacetylase ChbG (UPF0249 family)
MSSRLKLVVNADDLGLSSEVNREVERLHRLGVLSSATIMANGKAIDELLELQQRNPELGLGVHLNGTNFKALTSRMQMSRLCDENGFFNSSFRSELSLRLTNILADEWTSQVEYLLELGLVLDHLDSHHHVHTWPTALPALCKVAKSTGLNWVRNTRNFVPSKEKRGLRGFLKYGGKSVWSQSVSFLGMNVTDGFCSVFDFSEWRKVHPTEIPPLNTLELMCHPGDFGNLEYVQECDWLENSISQMLDAGLDLVRYSDL